MSQKLHELSPRPEKFAISGHTDSKTVVRQVRFFVGPVEDITEAHSSPTTQCVFEQHKITTEPMIKPLREYY